MIAEVAERADTQGDTDAELADNNANILLDPSEQARVELAASLCATPEEIRLYKPKLRALVEDAIAATGDPQEQRTLQMYLGVEEYALFGQPGDPVPPGYVFTGPHNLNAQAEYDPRACYCYDCNASSRARTGNAAVSEIQEAVFESRKTRADEIRQKAAAYIRLTPAYRMLRNITAELPTPPPDPYARLRKQTALLDRVQAGNQARIEDPTPQGLKARQEYSKGMAAIDMEEELEESRQRATKTRPSQSLQLAKGRFTQLLRRSYGIGSDSPVRAVKKYDYGGILFQVGEQTELLYNFGSSVIENTGITDGVSPLERFVSYDLFSEAYNIVLNPDFTGTYQSALEEAVRRAADRFTTKQLGALSRMPDYTLRMPPNSVIPGEEIARLHHYHQSWHYEVRQARTSEANVDFISREELDRRDKNIIGNVLVADRNARGPRLIQTVGSSPPADFHTQGASETLVLALKPQEFRGTPHIPGYILTSAARGTDTITYGFSQDPEGDPYTRAAMLIPNDARIRLADKYEEVGLHTLADALRASPHISVGELENLVQGETYYPIVKSKKIGNLPKAFVPKTLDDFQAVIKSKQLWAQCNGSGPFLAVSLQYCGFDAGTTTGNSFDPGKGPIKEAPHMQTYLNHNGRRYILDATGTLSAAQRLRAKAMSVGKTIATNLKVFRRVGKRAYAPPASHAPEILPVPEPAKVKLPSVLEKQQTVQERLRHVAATLELSLAPLFGASTREGLIKALSARGVRRSLEIGDPVDRTISIARRAINGELDDDEIASLARTIKAYPRHRTLNDRRGRPNYDQGTLDILADALLQIHLARA